MVLLERFWVRSRTHPTPALAAARLNVVDREASSGSASKQTQEPRKHPMNGARVLLVEDDLKLANLVKEYLEKSDCVVEIEGRGDRAVARILGENPDLVVLDLNLPGLDGLSVCREVRGKFSNPILMLTARGEEIDEVLGLEMGADDYMAKPVRPRLLLARLKNLLRRTTKGDEGVAQVVTDLVGAKRVVLGALVVDATNRNVTHGGEEIELTTAEFDLLWMLATHAGEVLSREEIYQEVRGDRKSVV